MCKYIYIYIYIYVYIYVYIYIYIYIYMATQGLDPSRFSVSRDES